MAEGVVSFAVQNLTDLLIQEAAFLLNVRDQVEQLRDELKWMQSFLKDADTKQEADERVRQWVSAIRDLAYDAEDIINNYILQIEEEKGNPPPPIRRRSRTLMAALKNCTTCISCSKGIKLHKIGNDIEAIQKKLHDLSRKREIYGIRNLGEASTSSLGERLRLLRRSSPYGDDEADIVGLNDTVKALVKQLTGDELRRCVISIVGMGGLGKTSLAKKIFNHHAIQSRFDVRAWVYVSQEYSTLDLLRKIIKSFTTPPKDDWEMMEKSIDVEDLERWLFNFLEHKRYLVVLDDVWDSTAWESLKRAFPNKNEGSRVLLTTRNTNVALNADDQRSPPHRLRFLTEDESWELFCKKAFPNNINGTDPSFCRPPVGLEELGRKMVKKCNGLPLGIIILGGLLSKKQPPSTYQWQRVLDGISQKLMKDKQDDQPISQILSLSYNELPYQLKFCFLHVGLFPEDSVIDTTKLIQLWVAEGFIRQGTEETMEDAAKESLNELIDRSMIQVEWNDWRGVRGCRIHDLLRDLSISKAKEEGFFEISRKVDYDHPLTARQRRLSVHFEIDRFVSSLECHCTVRYLRSLMFFKINKETVQLEQFRFIYTSFKLLKVLDLDYSVGNSSISVLPDSIGEMIHLRYLGLEGMDIEELPASIEKLQRLQTLRMGFDCKLPDVIWKMKQLRHLRGSWIGETMSHLKIDTLMNLQTLSYIRDDALIENELTKLTNLLNLGIEISGSWNADLLSASLSRLCNLQYLILRATKQLEAPIVLQSLQCYHLLSLTLKVKLERLPNNLQEFSPNLTQVTLWGCELERDPMVTLERLPNLLVLEIYFDAYIGREIICLEKGFPRLEVLVIGWLSNLEEWRVEEGAMPSLKTLHIHNCEKLKKIPEGLKFLTALRKLEFFAMPRNFEDRVLGGGGGEDSYKVQHVPSVTFQNTVRG